MLHFPGKKFWIGGADYWAQGTNPVTLYLNNKCKVPILGHMDQKKVSFFILFTMVALRTCILITLRGLFHIIM